MLPHIRFTMMPPKLLLQVEQSSLYVDLKHLFADKLHLAYRRHSLAMDDQDPTAAGKGGGGGGGDTSSPTSSSPPLLLLQDLEGYRNYKSEEYCLSHAFSLPGYANVNKIDTRVTLEVKARHKLVSSSRARQEDQTLFSVYFFPRGYFTTLTIYGSYMGRQTHDVTLKVIRRRPDLEPMAVDVTLVLRGKQNDLKYAAFTHSWSTLFTKDNHTLSVDKFLAADKLMEEDSPYLVDGALEGTVFLKIQDVGSHLLEAKEKK